MSLKIVAVALLVVLSVARTYPMYKQCDPKWGKQQLGTSTDTICSSGCLMSSVAMTLTALGKNFNPSSLNRWLTSNGGYEDGDLFVWESVFPLGLSYLGRVSNSNIASNLANDNVVIMNVHNGGHWVLATSMVGSTIYVNDPYYQTTSYSISEIVPNNSGLFHVSDGYLGVMIDALEIALNVNGRRDRMREADGGKIMIQ